MAEPADIMLVAGSHLSLADLNTTVNHEPRIGHRLLADLLGFVHVHKFAHLIERHMEALLRFGGVPSTVDETSAKGGRPGKTFWLNKKQALFVCTKSETPNATEATIQMVEVFDAFTSGRLAADVPAQVPALAAPLRKGLAIMTIGKRTVMVDTAAYDVRLNEEAVLIGVDGKFRIGRATLEPRASWMGKRHGLTRMRKLRPGEGPCGAIAGQKGVTIVGRIVPA